VKHTASKVLAFLLLVLVSSCAITSAPLQNRDLCPWIEDLIEVEYMSYQDAKERFPKCFE